VETHALPGGFVVFACPSEVRYGCRVTRRNRLKRAVLSFVILVVAGYQATCGNWAVAALIFLLSTPAASIVDSTGAKYRFFAEPLRPLKRYVRIPKPVERLQSTHFQLQLQRVSR
jgi:hypothetical protein